MDLGGAYCADTQCGSCFVVVPFVHGNTVSEIRCLCACFLSSMAADRISVPSICTGEVYEDGQGYSPFGIFCCLYIWSDVWIYVDIIEQAVFDMGIINDMASYASHVVIIPYY